MCTGVLSKRSSRPTTRSFQASSAPTGTCTIRTGISCPPASTSRRRTSRAKPKASGSCCSASVTRGRAFLYAFCLAMELGGIASGRPGVASTPWVPSREAWDRARAAYRDARWSGTLETIAENYAIAARSESVYLGSLESWALAKDTRFTPPRPGTLDQTRLREGVLDLADDGRNEAALRLLNGPLRDDPLMLPLRARLSGSATTPDSGLAVLDWPPDRRASASRAIAWDFLGRASGDEIDAARVAAAALADSAREPRAARAALWTLLGNPRPAVRSYAR